MANLLSLLFVAAASASGSFTRAAPEVSPDTGDSFDGRCGFPDHCALAGREAMGGRRSARGSR